MASQYEAEVALNTAIRANPAPWLGLMRARREKLEDKDREFGEKQSLLEMKLRSDEAIAAGRNRALVEQSKAMLDRASELDKQKMRERLILETGLTPNKDEEIDSFILRASKEKDQRALGTLRSFDASEEKIRKEIKALGETELKRQEKVKKEVADMLFASSFDISEEDKAAIAAVRKKQPAASARIALEATRIPADRKAQILGRLDAFDATAELEAAKVPKEFLQSADDLRTRLSDVEKGRMRFQATEGGQRALSLYYQPKPDYGEDTPTGYDPNDKSVGASAAAFKPMLGPPAPPATAAPTTPGVTAPSVGPAGAYSLPFRGAASGLGAVYDWLAGTYTRGRSGAGGVVAPPADTSSAAGLNPLSPLNPVQAPAGQIDWGGLNPYSPSAQARPTTPITMDARIAQIFGPDAASLLAEAGKLSEANGISLTDQGAVFNAALSGDPAAQQQISTVLDYVRQARAAQGGGSFGVRQGEMMNLPAFRPMVPTARQDALVNLPAFQPRPLTQGEQAANLYLHSKETMIPGWYNLSPEQQGSVTNWISANPERFGSDRTRNESVIADLLRETTGIPFSPVR